MAEEIPGLYLKFDLNNHELGESPTTYIQETKLSNNSDLIREIDDQSTYTAGSCDSTSFYHSNDSPEVSQASATDKMMMFNKKMLEVNLAYRNYMVSEFVLNIYKSINDSRPAVPEKLVKYVNDILLERQLNKITKIKTRNGENIDIFGSDHCSIERNIDLTSQEHLQLQSVVLRNLEDKVQQLKKKKNNVQEVCANNTIYQWNVVQEDNYPCQEKLNKFVELYNSLTEKMNVCTTLLEGLADVMEELFFVQESNNDQELELNKNSMMVAKAKYLRCTTRILELQIKLFLNKIKGHINYLNTEGNELNETVESLKEQLSQKKVRLNKYTSKEKMSSEFKKIVKAYGTTKMELQHKHHTLALLNEADTAARVFE